MIFLNIPSYVWGSLILLSLFFSGCVAVDKSVHWTCNDKCGNFIVDYDSASEQNLEDLLDLEIPLIK